MLSAFAERTEITSERWHLLTGDRALIYGLGREQYFVEEDRGLQRTEDEFLHTENLVLLDRQQRLRGIYNGLNETSVQQLIADAATLLDEE